MADKSVTISPAETLLAWYDRHHRVLPWRVSPAERQNGVLPDPYRVWLSEVMLQQTTVATVTGYFGAFLERWPRVDALAAAPVEDVMAAWAGLGYYSRARNLHACAQEVSARGGFPCEESALRGLPGIGPYTAAAIAAIAFDRPATVMDGNVERVMARRFSETEPLPAVKETLRAHAARLTPRARPGDYAQAVMDLGATICTPRKPACGICPWWSGCEGRLAGIAETLPRKAPKKAKPVRRGTAYIGIANDKVLTVRRPDKGLLGGMLALPTTEWAEAPPAPAPPTDAPWREIGEVRHTFTHFHLLLKVEYAAIPAETGDFRPPEEVIGDLPTVFAKALRLLAKVNNTDTKSTKSLPKFAL
ncbi:A/G-specific adenine glycosylase [Rhodobacteraceae bacterium NNCM2]|nr:A/G-specific adenine glycosylase [Coraliihabitans acroporae]